MSATTSTLPAWKVQTFPTMPDSAANQQRIDNATLSAADSGAIYWDKPAPRSYVRGAVYDHAGRLCAESQRMGGVNSDLVISTNPPVLHARERDEATRNNLAGHWLYAGSWMHGFGHFLVETLPTLWPLFEDGADFDGITAHRFNSPRLHKWQTEIMSLITDLPVHVITDAPATAERITIPTRPYHYQRAIHPLAGKVWAAIAERINTTSGNPVYLSRTKFHEQAATKTGREYTNSAAVDDVFRDQGFDVLYPETMTATEQARRVNAAPILAGQAGSALHLSVFMKPGGRVLELGDSRTGADLVSTQRAISSVAGQAVAQIPYRGDEAGNLDLKGLRRSLDALTR